jgi:hypothetical protein
VIDAAAGKDRTVVSGNDFNFMDKDTMGSRLTDKFYSKRDAVEKEYDRQVASGKVEKGKPTDKVKAYRQMGDYLKDMRKLKEEARTSNLSTKEKMEIERQISRAIKDATRFANGGDINDQENLNQVVEWVDRYRDSKK